MPMISILSTLECFGGRPRDQKAVCCNLGLSSDWTKLLLLLLSLLQEAIHDGGGGSIHDIADADSSGDSEPAGKSAQGVQVLTNSMQLWASLAPGCLLSKLHGYWKTAVLTVYGHVIANQLFNTQELCWASKLACQPADSLSGPLCVILQSILLLQLKPASISCAQLVQHSFCCVPAV